MMLQFYANRSRGVLIRLTLMMAMVMFWNGKQVEARHVLGQQRIQVYRRTGIPEIGTTMGLPIWRSTGSTASGNGSKQHKNEDKNDYYDDDDDIDDNLNDGDDDGDGDDDDGDDEDYDENAPKVITNNNKNDQNLKEDKLLRLIALNAAHQKHTTISGDAVDDSIANGRAVDHVDESRTFFKHKHSGGGGGGGGGGSGGGGFYGGAPNYAPPLFIVPINMSNFNNNTVNAATTTTTTVAPARRIAYIDNGFPQADFYRAPYMSNSFRRRAQNDNPNAMLPYGLMTVWDGAQVLPVATIHRTVGPDLHYVPLNLQRFGNNGGPDIGGIGGGVAVGGGGGFGLSDTALNTANNNNNNEDDDDFGDNGLTESDGRFNLFSSRWRTNPNRNVYESTNPFTAFANNFRRIQYM